MPEVSLRLGGKSYAGWKGVRITRSMDRIADKFVLDVTDRWGQEGARRTVWPGSYCVVDVDGERAVTGYVDTTEVDYDNKTHGLTVTGRSLTGDLVDCSVVSKPGQWANRKLEQIAAELVAPFKVKVKTEVSTGEAFRTYAVQEGETVHEALERAAKMRGVMLTTNAYGQLVITRAGRSRGGSLRFGVNVLSGRVQRSWEGRHNAYIVKGQAGGLDTFFGKDAAAPKAVVADAGVTRYRPLVILADGDATGADLTQRGILERNVRGGRGQRLTYRVRGHLTPAGHLWRPNTMVSVQDELGRIRADLLLVTVNLVINAQGTQTELTLMPRGAFDVGPPPPLVDTSPKGLLETLRAEAAKVAEQAGEALGVGD